MQARPDWLEGGWRWRVQFSLRLLSPPWPVVSDDRLVTIETCVVARLFDRRNAWHDTTTGEEFFGSPVFSDVASAKVGAERRRKQGTRFEIQETPALILRGAENAFMVSELHSVSPFAAFDGFSLRVREGEPNEIIEGLYPGVTLLNALLTFRSLRWYGGMWKYEAYVYFCAVDPTLQIDREESPPLRSYRSYVQGKDMRLGWDETTYEGSRTDAGARAVVEAWEALSN